MNKRKNKQLVKKKLEDLSKVTSNSDLQKKELSNSRIKLYDIFKLSNIALIFGIIAAMATILVSIPMIRYNFLSPKEKFERDHFRSGDLKPNKITNRNASFSEYVVSETRPFFLNKITDRFPKIKGILVEKFDTKQEIILNLGGLPIHCKPKDFYKGIDIFLSKFADCTKVKLTIAVNNDRIYVSTEFKDLEKEQVIGNIEFNHWRLFNDNMLDFNNDDEKLEVKDRQGNIVFSIKYDMLDDSTSLVNISGYFIDYTSVLVLPNVILTNKGAELKGNTIIQCISKNDTNWKKQAQYDIQFIKTIF